MKNKIVTVNDKVQKNYSYILSQPTGSNFHSEFQPQLSPSEMLELGVFGGRYLRDCRNEFPESWFKNARLYAGNEAAGDKHLNFFKVRASQSLKYWRTKGWIYHEDPRGWFQWYCRYYLGRRIDDDLRQIKRWKAMVRHIAQLKKNCEPGDLACRIKQRQALLHWAYDSTGI